MTTPIYLCAILVIIRTLDYVIARKFLFRHSYYVILNCKIP